MRGAKGRAAGAIVVGLTLALSMAGLAACSRTNRDLIRIDGSSTVYPITQAAAEEFQLVTRVRIPVNFSGTGGGFERFCRGEIDISDASRPIKDEELEACAEEGITDVIEFQVAIDALTVAVPPSNEFVDCMTTTEINLAFRRGGASSWSDIRPEWPEDTIDFYYPGADSGTFDYFVEAIIEGIDEESVHRSDGTASEDDNVLAQGIENDEDAIGYFGFAYFQEAGQRLKAIAVDSGDGTCVEPMVETALDGSYTPLSRPLFIYTSETLLAERPEIADFIAFYLDNSEGLATEVGYVPMSAELQAEQRAKVDRFLP